MFPSEVFCDAKGSSHHHPSLQPCPPIGRLLEAVARLQEGAPPWPDPPASEAPQPPVGAKLTLRHGAGHRQGFRHCFLEVYAPSHQFLEIVIAPNVDAVEEDLRDGTSSRQLFHPR